MNNKSITKRWIKGSLTTTVIVLVFAMVFLMVFVRNSYYSAAENAILSRINTINGTLAASSRLSDSERTQMLYRMSEEFTEKEKFEFMFIGVNGKILATSSGFMPGDEIHMEDIGKAQSAIDGIATNVYRTALGEKVMTATCVIHPDIDNIYAIRLVTSLEKVDGEINILAGFAALMFVAIIAFSVMSGMYFVRSIVYPIRDIESTAAQISKGEFGVRIDNSYDGEIGQLVDTINNMAEELGRSDEIKNEFISSVSHELRTPLTAIKGWAETMNNSGDRTTVEKGTQVILSETERLYSMVENLLDFSRLQNADIKLTKEKLDLVAEISEVAIMFRPRCRQSGIELVFDEPEDIIPVYGDKSRLKQVMVNLLDNSIKYTPVGGKIEITVDYDRKNGLVHVSVKDNGKGIHKEDIEKVTQKFYKGKGAKRGSGIGLALVQEIITIHGGQFTVDSEYGKYTNMTFTLHTVRSMKGK
ncbi:MAG: HAMP domain-containing histidine kinase [Ruminococcaceae bacterium]|nr:HAMP domain-containing histidine kinase [Oscillospiraceae bacterium]